MPRELLEVQVLEVPQAVLESKEQQVAQVLMELQEERGLLELQGVLALVKTERLEERDSRVRQVVLV